MNKVGYWKACLVSVNRILLYIIIIEVFFNITSCSISNRLPSPSLYSITNLKELKQKGVGDSEVSSFVTAVYKRLNEEPHSVMEKKHSYSPNPHDYCSLAPYSWPDDDPNKPYVTKDGLINPERNEYDRPRLTQFALLLKQLGIAYYITHDSRFFERFESVLNIWFICPQTYMEPNMEYAQVVKGRNDNKGQYYGLVDMLEFTNIIESILLVNSIKRIDNNLLVQLREWFTSFLDWLFTSNQWAQLSVSNNNIITGSYVAIIEMANFVGNTELANRMTKDFSDRILYTQIDEDGKQPAELKRTIGFGYSVNNLSYIVDFCLIAENAGVHFYRDNQRIIDSAFEYLFQFKGNHIEFPYKQIQEWDFYEEKLLRYAGKLKRMKSREKREFDVVHKADIVTKSVLEYVQ